MLEIPESTTLAKQVAREFLGHRVLQVKAGQSSHGFAFFNPEPEEYPLLLCEKTLEAVEVHGGLVELLLEDMHLVFNDGVNVRFVAPDGALPKKHQLYIRFDNDAAIVCTISMYGGMMVYPQGISDNFYFNIAHEKPSPLSNEFDRRYFETLIKSVEDKISTKAFLATEQRIPGLGNGTLQDILFNARINPQRKLKTLSKEDFDMLYTSVKNTLSEMIALGGRNTDKDFYGKEGGYACILSNKTKDEPCPRCGSVIVKKTFLGGNVYFCPQCQPL